MGVLFQLQWVWSKFPSHRASGCFRNWDLGSQCLAFWCGIDVPFMNSIINGVLFLRLGNLFNPSHRCHYWWTQKWKQVLLLLYIMFFITCLTNPKGTLCRSLFSGNSILLLFLVSTLFVPPFTSWEYMFQVLIPSLRIFWDATHLQIGIVLYVYILLSIFEFQIIFCLNKH